MTGKTFFFEGRELPLDDVDFAGARLLRSFGSPVRIPPRDEPPYLFCGNGSCRDCNLSVDGFPDLPACRIPLVAGMSLRRGEGAGEENALSRQLPRAVEGEPLACDVLVVGAGPAGRAAAAEARALGVETVLVDARTDAGAPRPAGVADGRLHVFENGARRLVRSRAVILANGARDVVPAFPGSTLAGVLPWDLLDRYLALGGVLAGSFVTTIDPREIDGVSGSARVERVRLAGVERLVAADLVFVRRRREPELSLAKALGCRTLYDRELRGERLVVGEGGETTIPGVFAAGDVVRVGSETDAIEAGRRSAVAAARLLRKTSADPA